MHKFFVHASALKPLKPLVHGEIAIILSPLYLPIKDKKEKFDQFFFSMRSTKKKEYDIDKSRLRKPTKSNHLV